MSAEIVAAAAAVYSFDKLGLREMLVELAKPTLQHYGEKIRDDFFKAKIDCFGKALKSAIQKCSKQGDSNPKSPHQAVFKEVFTSADYDYTNIYADYYGGVLATSSEFNQNDIGQQICKMINRLSSYDLRFHYILYNSLRNRLKGKEIHLGDNTYSSAIRVFIAEEDLYNCMSFPESDRNIADQISNNCIRVLAKEKLIDDSFSHATASFIKEKFGLERPGFVLSPTDAGASLLLWSEGYGLKDSSILFSEDITISNLNSVQIPECTIVVPQQGMNASDLKRREDFINSITT